MKDQKVIDQLVRQRVMEILTRSYGIQPYQPLSEEWEKFIKGKG